MKPSHVRYLQPCKFFNGLADIQAGEIVKITRPMGKGWAWVARENGDSWAEIGIDGVRAEYCEARNCKRCSVLFIPCDGEFSRCNDCMETPFGV